MLIVRSGKVTDVESISEESSGPQASPTVSDQADSSDYPFVLEAGGLELFFSSLSN